MKGSLLSNVLKLFLSLGIGGLIIWFTIGKLDQQQIDAILQVFKRADYLWIVLGPLVGMLSNVVRAERWRMLLNSIGYYPKFSNITHSVFVMYAGNLLFPRLGEVSRCTLLYKTDQVPIEKSIGTMVVERMIDLITMLLMGLIVFIFQADVFLKFFKEKVQIDPLQLAQNLLNKYWFFGILGLLCLFALAIYMWNNKQNPIVIKINQLFNGLIESVLSIFKLKNPFLFIFHSILIWVMYWAMIFLCFKALPESAGLGVIAGMACVFFGGFAFIVSQGGIGAYPPTIGAVFVLYGVAYEIGFAFGWLVWTLQTLSVIIMGVVSFYLLSRNFSPATSTNKNE